MFPKKERDTKAYFSRMSYLPTTHLLLAKPSKYEQIIANVSFKKRLNTGNQ